MEKEPKEILSTPESKKEKIYVCGSCGFNTKKIENTHQEKDGDVIHDCPNCSDSTSSRSRRSQYTVIRDLELLEKKGDLQYLDSAYGHRDDCEKCKK